MFAKAFLATLAVAVLIVAPLQAMAERVALVIGMGAYEHVVALKNTINDANNIARKLEEIGFTVTLATDKTQVELLDIMQSFSFQAETADLALVYYAGHGVEVAGTNYLVPVDAQVKVATDIERVGIPLSQILKTVDAARKMRVVILDSCRNNPFIGIKGFDTGTDTSLSGNTADPTAPPAGLAPVNPEQGTMVAYAAKAGQVALDGTGEDSPYATALMNAFGKKDLEIGLMFRQVRDDVLAQTNNLQEPFQYGSLSGTPFYLASDAPDGSGGPETANMQVAWSDTIKPDEEAQYMSLADGGDTRSMLSLGYMRLNPDGPRYDPSEAVKYLSKAAEAGNAEAQFELAKLYERGLGVDPDPVKALELYQKSAASGFADALNDLGFLYYQGGLGLTPDHVKGIDLFRQAADQRHPEAQFNYAALIDDGNVEGKGPEDAAQYLYQALRSGSRAVFNQLSTAPDRFSVKARIALQKILKSHSFYEGPLDGDFGKSTQAAIKVAYGVQG